MTSPGKRPGIVKSPNHWAIKRGEILNLNKAIDDPMQVNQIRIQS
jgi:hypothetical protein